MNATPDRRQRHVGRVLLAALLIGGTIELVAGLWVPAKAAVAQQLLEHAWDRARGGDADARPWPWADAIPFARLDAPKLARSWIVLAGASGRNLAFAPAHMNGSAVPGEDGVAVIAGHRDTHFDALGELAVGDRLELERPDGRRFAYSIVAIDIVDSTRTSLRLDDDESVLTLVTCYPFVALTSGGSLRYVVTARTAAATAF